MAPTLVVHGTAGLELLGTFPCTWAKENYRPRGTRLYPEHYSVESRLSQSYLKNRPSR